MVKQSIKEILKTPIFSAFLICTFPSRRSFPFEFNYMHRNGFISQNTGRLEKVVKKMESKKLVKYLPGAN